MIFLLDVNLWVALAFQKHAHHAVAKAWFNGLTNDECAFCRMTQQGFLRLASNPKVLGDEAVPMSMAWAIFDGFVDDPRVIFADEPNQVEVQWRSKTERESFTPKI
jgi:toxin-antitoxin system PIN domain toxin